MLIVKDYTVPSAYNSSLCEGHLRFLPPFLESDVREDLPTHILLEMLQRDDLKTAHLHHLLLRQEIHAIPGKPPFQGDKVVVANLLRRNLGDAEVFKKLCEYGMVIQGSDIALALELFMKKELDAGVYKFVMMQQKRTVKTEESQVSEVSCGG